jgi:hypothetical protein
MEEATLQGRKLSLASLMVVVAIVAIELAAFRLLSSYLVWLAFVPVLSGLVLQFGLFNLATRRGRHRMFWAGFVGAVSFALMSFVWEESAPNNRTFFGSPWLSYMNTVDRFQPALSIRTNPRTWPVTLVVTNAAVLFLPQLLVGLAGGILLRVVFSRRESARAGPA